MSYDKAKYDRHIALSESHATLAQAIKYPGTVEPGTVQRAREFIAAVEVLTRESPNSQPPGNGR